MLSKLIVLLFSSSLSLIHAATNIATGTNVQAIPLSPNIISGNVAAQVSGWGSALANGGASSTTLQRITTETLPLISCRPLFTPQYADRLNDNKLCTLTRSIQGTCFGDEGGALVVGGQVIGVVSWQVPCATGLPDVYESIASKRLWILSIIT